MTLTHIIPSLRGTIAAPLRQDLWPAFTTASTVDVTIAGVSLLRLVDWCDTPCVHTAAALTSVARKSHSDTASVIVARVLAVDPHGDDLDGAGSLDIRIDADLGGCTAFLSETRMIGRVSTAPDTVVHLRSGSGDCSIPVELAGDIHLGDLLAIPCGGTTCLHEIDPNHLHQTATAVDHDAQPVLLPLCEK